LIPKAARVGIASQLRFQLPSKDLSNGIIQRNYSQLSVSPFFQSTDEQIIAAAAAAAAAVAVDQQLILILMMAQSSFYPQTAIPSDLALAHREKYERAADRIVKNLDQLLWQE
jgi:hypothetical protein